MLNKKLLLNKLKLNNLFLIISKTKVFKMLFITEVILFSQICLVNADVLICDKTAEPANPDTIPSARNVLNCIKSAEGKYLLSGQFGYIIATTKVGNPLYTFDDKIALVTGGVMVNGKIVGGKMSAIREYGAHGDNGPGVSWDSAVDTDTKIVKEWKENNRIPAFSWHMSLPPFPERMDVVNLAVNPATGQRIYTNHDTYLSLTTPGNPIYNSFIAKLDFMGKRLQEFQRQGIPVIWRPFHEMRYFWWGFPGSPSSGEDTKNLYRFMYEYYTGRGNTYYKGPPTQWKLNNLIWIWAATPGENRDPLTVENMLRADYAGDNYVDVVGCDYYVSGSYWGTGEYNYYLSRYNILKKIAPGKPAALTEMDVNPDPNELFKRSMNLVWFNTWQDGGTVEYPAIIFSRNSDAWLATIYNHSLVITADELPNLKAPAAPVNITLIGDSITGTYTGPLYTLLNPDLPKENYKYLNNLILGGHSINDLKADVASLPVSNSSGIILLNIGTVDVGHYQTFNTGETFADLANRLSSLIDMITGTSTVTGKFPNAKLYAASIVPMARQYPALWWDSSGVAKSQTALDEQAAAYNAAIQLMVKAKGGNVYFFDLNAHAGISTDPNISLALGGPDFGVTNGIITNAHPSVKGATKIAAAWYKFLTQTPVLPPPLPSAVAAIPVFSPPAGTYVAAQNVSISTVTAGATIYYTLDGSDPASSPTRTIYTSPIYVLYAKNIKAKAFKDGMAPSTTVLAAYTIANPVLTSISVSPSLASLAVGSSQLFIANPKNQFGNPMAMTVTWSSSNTSAGTISPNGLFTALAAGTTTITASNGTIKGAIAVVVTASFTLSSAANIIVNPGLESGTAAWNFYTSSAGAFEINSPGFAGNNAAKIVLSSGGGNIQLFQTGLTLAPNTRYRLSFAAYSNSGRDLTVNLIKHGSPYTNYGLAFTANLGTSWQVFSTEFTTGGFTNSVNDGRLMFWLAPFAAAGDNYYIDNVTLEAVSGQTLTPIIIPSSVSVPVNLAPNPGFETDPTVNYDHFGSGTFSWANDYKHSGEKSLKIVSFQPIGQFARWISKREQISAAAGKTYTASVWMKTNELRQYGELLINFWDANLNYLNKYYLSNHITGTTDWAKLTVSGIAPENTKYIRAEFRLYGPGTVWVDDVELK